MGAPFYLRVNIASCNMMPLGTLSENWWLGHQNGYYLGWCPNGFRLGYPDDARVILKGIFLPAQHWILQSVPPNYRIEKYCQLLLDTCSPMVGWPEARSSWVGSHHFFGIFILPCNFLKFPHFKQIISKNYVQLVWIFQKFALVEVRKMKKTL